MSIAADAADLPDDDRQAWWESLDPKTRAALLYDWDFWARDEQKYPVGDWLVWLLLGGRGAGKSRTGSETIRRWSKNRSRLGLVGATSADARDVMIEGDSGILSIHPPDERPVYEPSKRKLSWPNGCIANVYSADEPDRLRGPQFEGVWIDELCLVAGTMVEMAVGPCDIQRVRRGDLVWTRDGLRTVGRAEMTGERPVWRLVCEDGGVLEGSADHPILTERGWVALSAIRPGDILTGWNESSGMADSGISTTGTAITAADQESFFIERCGNRLTARSRRDTTSITGTKTRATTPWGTSLVSHPQRTWPHTDRGDGRAGQTSNGARPFVVPGRADSQHRGPVRAAGLSSRHPANAPSFARQLARCATTNERVASFVAPTGYGARLFNLQVEGTPEFFANGILVHNCAWRYPQATWDNVMLGLRLGSDPRAVVTTTPRPIPIIKTLVASPTTYLSKESTYANLDNLAPAFREQVLTKYEGTTLGRQELYAEIIDDVEGALWTRRTIEANRTHNPPQMVRIVVGVDPPGSATGAECGIVAAGMDDQHPAHYYVLDDRSLQGSPDTWGNDAVTTYRIRNADRMIGERNFGGDMVESTIRTIDPDVSYRDVVSSRGKRLRAEPIAALAEQGRLHHVGSFGPLEDELCSWVDAPGQPSPNRLDALVFAVAELVRGGGGQATATLPKTSVPVPY